MTPETVPAGRLVLHGRVLPASNATFVGEIDGVRVVYKPIRGERPLWDFPDGTLARREVAAHAVSLTTGWDIVPPTVMRGGPHGPGMLQLWREADERQAPVDILPAGELPAGVRRVFEGLDAHDRPVVLVHEDSPALRRMAVFDVLVNNADRKGGHVLAMANGHRHGVDHGLTFHPDPKLRTVLWGWLGEPLADEELAGIRRVAEALAGDLGQTLGELLTSAEIEAVANRAAHLLATGVFPEPPVTSYPVIPWPPF